MTSLDRSHSFPALLRAAIIVKHQALLRRHRSSFPRTRAGSGVVLSVGPQSPPGSEI